LNYPIGRLRCSKGGHIEQTAIKQSCRESRGRLGDREAGRGGKARYRMPDDRRQMTDDRGRKTDDRGMLLGIRKGDQEECSDVKGGCRFQASGRMLRFQISIWHRSQGSLHTLSNFDVSSTVDREGCWTY